MPLLNSHALTAADSLFTKYIILQKNKHLLYSIKLLFQHQRIPNLIQMAFHTCVGGCDGCLNFADQNNKGMPVRLSVYPPISLVSLYVTVFLSVCLSVCLCSCLCIFPSGCLHLCLSICLSVCPVILTQESAVWALVINDCCQLYIDVFMPQDWEGVMPKSDAYVTEKYCHSL